MMMIIKLNDVIKYNTKLTFLLQTNTNQISKDKIIK